MPSFNRYEVLGHAGRDAELKYTQSGQGVMNVSVATTRYWKDSKSGEKKEETEWHDVVYWGGEKVAPLIKKGALIMATGRKRTREYEAKDGTTRYVTELMADRVYVMTPKGNGGGEKQAEDHQETAYHGSEDDIPF